MKVYQLESIRKGQRSALVLASVLVV